MEQAKSSGLIELVLSDEAAPEPPSRIDGVVIGTIVGVDADGTALVTYDHGPAQRLRARSVVPIDSGHVDRDVALMFEGSDPAKPIVMGLMFVPKLVNPIDQEEQARAPIEQAKATPTVERDGERLVFAAEREIVLQCGRSSITLTRAGKILIKGAYVSSRSTGVNRILGGSVQIN